MSRQTTQRSAPKPVQLERRQRLHLHLRWDKTEEEDLLSDIVMVPTNKACQHTVDILLTYYFKQVMHMFDV